MSLTLSKDELIELTSRRHNSAQARVLRALGVDFRRRPDGSIVVLREDLQTRLAPANVQGQEINWE